MTRFRMTVAALALLLAACSGAATSVTGEGEADGSKPTSIMAQDGSSSTIKVDPGEDGVLTLSDFVPGFDGGDLAEVDWRSQELEIEHKVAQCMMAEGFRYIAFVPSDVPGGLGYDEFDEAVEVERYGFGIATWVLEQGRSGDKPGDDPWTDDPNREIIETMDDAAREEYQRLLHGTPPDLVANTPQEVFDAMSIEEQQQFYDEAYDGWEPDGCYHQARASVPDQGETDSFFDEFAADLNDVFSKADSDPRLLQAHADWSACMARKGHDFASPDDMYGYFFGDEFGEGDFSKRVNELITWPQPDVGDDSESGVATTTITTTGEASEPEYRGPEYDMELLQPLIDEEIAVATADYECSKDIRKLLAEVHDGLEQQFLDENMDRLIGFMEKRSQAG